MPFTATSNVELNKKPSIIPGVRKIQPTKSVSDLPQFLTNEYEQPSTNSQVQWYPDSHHLVILEEKEIVIIDYDGTNKTTVYSGPFEKSFFSISPDEKLVILTNLNPQNNAFADLYGVGI